MKALAFALGALGLLAFANYRKSRTSVRAKQPLMEQPRPRRARRMRLRHRTEDGLLDLNSATLLELKRTQRRWRCVRQSHHREPSLPHQDRSGRTASYPGRGLRDDQTLRHGQTRHLAVQKMGLGVRSLPTRFPGSSCDAQSWPHSV